LPGCRAAESPGNPSFEEMDRRVKPGDDRRGIARMIRPVFTEIVLFLTPFALYTAFLWATKSEIIHSDHWPLSRIFTLTIVALLLVLVSFLYFANYTGAPVGSTYEPAHMENGQFVPGRTVR
jgi:hypothetical protein